MKSAFRGWEYVAESLRKQADECRNSTASNRWLNKGQCASLDAIAKRIVDHGVIIADEVGMGKTRIAVAVAAAVIQAKGRVAIAVPPGLGFQWEEELRNGQVKDVPAILRSLGAYLQAWESEDVEEQAPWFERSLVLVSHAFANWRLGETAKRWRTALLPEVYAHWQQQRTGRLPRYYRDNPAIEAHRTKNAGKSIAAAVAQDPRHPGRSFLDNKVPEKFTWSKDLDYDYGRNSSLRYLLERTVGLGLGVFDLVIIDEAHKSRGADTGLSRLLNTVLITAPQVRKICMTATPVELDVSQWRDPLARIGLNEKKFDELQPVIDTYAEAVRQLRQCWRGSEQARERFTHAARAYKEALSPYILRRDKREDEAVQNFLRISQLDISQYRQEREILVNMAQQPQHWKVAVCGAEALSVAIRHQEDVVAQRLRLTLGNGHGIAAFLDASTRSEEEDKRQEDHDAAIGESGDTPLQHEAETSASAKRLQRGQWWHEKIEKGFERAEMALYDHPGIGAAVDAIEKYTTRGEKVLVFGRFTQPMRHLTQLLNAREMLRRIETEGQAWPQQGVGEGERPAVRAAWRQLKGQLSFGFNEVNRRLDTQYRRADTARERFRASLVEQLGEGLRGADGNAEKQYITPYNALCTGEGNDDFNVVAHALMELLGGAGSVDSVNMTSGQVASTFKELVDSSMDRDDPDIDANDDGDIDEYEAEFFWKNLLSRIKEEYGVRRSGFARFMFGGTAPSSRRLIQQAFNRTNCFPRVLVAQSMVGREGLNLHRACKTVVLLHPEWNPGIVEQQIGRVDRVSSRWSKALHDAIEQGVSGDDLPRIEVLPIVFQGTYDEYNWSVLRGRWDDLRAQLHGIVIPTQAADMDEEGRKIVEGIMKNSPKFSPL